MAQQDAVQTGAAVDAEEVMIRKNSNFHVVVDHGNGNFPRRKVTTGLQNGRRRTCWFLLIMQLMA